MANSFYFFSKHNFFEKKLNKKKLNFYIHKKNIITNDNLRKFINIILSNSFEGEMYNLNIFNVRKFANSLKKYLSY